MSKVNEENPFTLPSMNEKKFLENEKRKAMQERKALTLLPLHKRTTASFRAGLFHSDVLQSIPSPSVPRATPRSVTSIIKNDPDFITAVKTGEKIRAMENVKAYIKSKRENLLLQYTIGLKKDEMLTLENTEKNEEKRLSSEERMLEEDAKKFDSFLKANAQGVLNAAKQAEVEAKMKVEKVAELKRIHIQITSIRSEITKLEDSLLELESYKKFLYKLSPLEWQLEQEELKETRKAAKAVTKKIPSLLGEKKPLEKHGELQLRRTSRHGRSSIGGHSRQSVSSLQRKRHRSFDKKEVEAQLISDLESSSSSLMLPSQESVLSPLASGIVAEEDEDEDDTESPPIYFSHPQQLLDIMVILENKCLLMIIKTQESEENLEETHLVNEHSHVTMQEELTFLRRQIQHLERQLKQETKRGKDFETRSQLYSYGEFDEDIQEITLQELKVTIEYVYESIFGKNNANLSMLEMMASIESKLEELLEIAESLPLSNLQQADTMRERMKRTAFREIKIHEQSVLAMKKQEKAKEKMKYVPKSIPRRKLVFRSNPPQAKLKTIHPAWLSREEEEHMYFFT